MIQVLSITGRPSSNLECQASALAPESSIPIPEPVAPPGTGAVQLHCVSVPSRPYVDGVLQLKKSADAEQSRADAAGASVARTRRGTPTRLCLFARARLPPLRCRCYPMVERLSYGFARIRHENFFRLFLIQNLRETCQLRESDVRSDCDPQSPERVSSTPRIRPATGVRQVKRRARRLRASGASRLWGPDRPAGRPRGRHAAPRSSVWTARRSGRLREGCPPYSP
jgi:hypothetical protein